MRSVLVRSAGTDAVSASSERQALCTCALSGPHRHSSIVKSLARSSRVVLRGHNARGGVLIAIGDPTRLQSSSAKAVSWLYDAGRSRGLKQPYFMALGHHIWSSTLVNHAVGTGRPVVPGGVAHVAQRKTTSRAAPADPSFTHPKPRPSSRSRFAPGRRAPNRRPTANVSWGLRVEICDRGTFLFTDPVVPSSCVSCSCTGDQGVPRGLGPATLAAAEAWQVLQAMDMLMRRESSV